MFAFFGHVSGVLWLVTSQIRLECELPSGGFGLQVFSFLVVEYLNKVVHLLHVVTALVSCVFLAAYFIHSRSQL